MSGTPPENPHKSYARPEFWQLSMRCCQLAGAVDVAFLFIFLMLGSPILAWVNVISVAMYVYAYRAFSQRRNRLAILLIRTEVLVHAGLGTMLQLRLPEGHPRQAVDRDIAVDMLTQGREVQVQAGELVDQEQWPLLTGGTHGYHLIVRAHIAAAAVQQERQRRDTGVLEQFGQGHRQPGQRQLADQPYRQQRMTAQGEEVVVTTHPLQVEHLGPDLRQATFQIAVRRLEGVGGELLRLRRRQGPHVDLAVERQGQGIQANADTR